MRAPWRLAGLSLGFLLIAGVICTVVLPSVIHLIYPDSLPTSAQKREIRYAAIPEDRQIDELGAPEQIRTEADARAYVEALVKRWDPNETNPHLPEFKEQLTQAEYAAVRNPERRIPESQVAKTFNRLMDEWQMPGWTRISVPELHAFRIIYASGVYPRSVARLPDRSIAPGCRPTEALFLLDMLNFSGGVPPQIRDQVRANRWPLSLLKRLEWSRPTERRVEEGLRAETTPTPDGLQRHKYWTLQRNYFANHPTIRFESEVQELFSQLGIQ
jgi:hypothetical protein